MNRTPYREETSKILELIEKLNQFEKTDLVDYLVDKEWDANRIEQLVEGLGYVEYDSIDNVREVIQNGQEYEVLDEMSDYDIADYVINHGVLDNVISEMNNDDIVNALIFKNIDEDDIADILVGLIKERNSKLTLGKIVDAVTEKL